jgi:hypothetical protein
MRRVTDFLSRGGVSSTPETLAALTGKPQGATHPDDDGKSPFVHVGERIGEDNEALRHLLIDTGLQFDALDELKETFGKLIDPPHKLISTLEQARQCQPARRAVGAAQQPRRLARRFPDA